MINQNNETNLLNWGGVCEMAELGRKSKSKGRQEGKREGGGESRGEEGRSRWPAQSSPWLRQGKGAWRNCFGACSVFVPISVNYN